MDSSVKPGDDFFEYVNGSWLKRTEIPADRTFAGIDSVLNDKIDSDVRAIVEDLARNPQSSGRVGQQVGDMYASWMDVDAVEKAGTAPLEPYLKKIAAVKTRGELVDLFGSPEYESPISIGIYPDFKGPTHYMVYANQGGLGLPNRDYYLLKEDKYVAYRKAYRDYIVTIEKLAGIPDAEAKADRIIALETEIAKIHWTEERSRDVEAIYNPKTRAQLAAFAPQLDWNRMLAKLGLAKHPIIVVAQPSAIQAEAKLFASVPLQTWKDWSAFHFVSSNAQFLPRAFDDAQFNFYSKTLHDVQTQRDRWKRGVDLVDGTLGEALGKVYVDRHYPAESDRQMHELIGNILAAL